MPAAPAGTDRRRAGRRRWLWGMLLGVLAALLLGAGLLVFRSRAAEPPEEEIDFTLDRPFLFVITSPDNLPMFVGVVNDPA